MEGKSEETASTKIRNIAVSVTMGTILIPIAVIEPVIVGERFLTAIDLRNQEYISKMDIREGDIVTVGLDRDGQPEILTVNKEKRQKDSVPFQMPCRRPICGGNTQQARNGGIMCAGYCWG